jgi:hypothetical protein
MSQLKFTIVIDIPDGAHVAIGEPPEATGDPAEPAPIPGTTPQFVPQQVIPQQAAPQGPPVCPIHHDSHFIPAGISKKPGGKAYKSFRGCTERECSWRVDADS